MHSFDRFYDEAVRGLLGEPRWLRYAIAFALRRARKVVHGLKEGASESERYAVAGTSFGESRSAAIRGLRKCTNSTLFCGRS